MEDLRTDEIMDGDQPQPEMKLQIPAGATVAQRKQLLSYIGGAKQLIEEQNNVLEIRGAVYHADILRDRDGTPIMQIDRDSGEIINPYSPCMRTIFLLTDGTKRTSTSPVLYRYVKDNLIPIMTADGQMGHFLEPVKLKIVMTPTKSGGRTYDVTLVED